MSFFGNSESYYSILVNLSSGSLSVSVVLYKKGDSPTFIYTCRKNIDIPEKLDLHKIEQGTMTLLDQCILEAIQNGLKNFNNNTDKEIKNVVVSLSSPWFYLKTESVKDSNDKPVLISEDYIKSLTQKKIDEFEAEVQKLNDDPDTSYEVVEKSIVDVKVNGYKINKIVGQKTTTLDAHLCMSLVEKNFLSNIYDIAHKHTHLVKDKIIIHTLPLVYFTVTRDLFSGYDNFLLLNVSSEYTDISIVTNGVLYATSSFPSGRNFIIRQISKELAIPCEIAESSLRLFVSKKLDGENTRKIENILVNIEKEWAVYFERALSEVSPGGQFPTRLYMVSFDDVYDIYSQMIKLEKADITADFRKSVSIIKINNAIFDGHIKNQSHTIPEDNLSVLAVFWNKFAFQ